MKLLKIFKLLLFSPIFLCCITIYKYSRNKEIIDSDMFRLGYSNSSGLLQLLLVNKEFRNIFYFRIGIVSELLNVCLPKNSNLHIMTSEIGSGLIIVHGDASYINAQSIGENCYINQSVTIGVIGTGKPVIGNNVRIASGAIVLGQITIGDNVNISAGAVVVVKNVPDNCTVIGNPSFIVKRNGQRVNEKLGSI